jgi:inosine/xanthosine triphosphatase
MEKILVAVGSTRRPKLNAVAEAVNAFAPAWSPSVQFEIIGAEVDSGVSHTPSTCGELMRGARQRAEALIRLAAEKGERWGYFVGLEGGLDVLHENGGRRAFLESWAFATDGSVGYYGRSGAVELPEALAHEVLENQTELSVAIDRFAVIHDPDRFAGAVGIRDAQGAWGVLSNNLITRQEAFRIAVLAAFAPFYNGKMYRTAAAAR